MATNVIGNVIASYDNISLAKIIPIEVIIIPPKNELVKQNTSFKVSIKFVIDNN